MTTAAAPEQPSDSERWNLRYQARLDEGDAVERPEIPDGRRPRLDRYPAAIDRLRSLLPLEGRAVDLAGGDGGGALYLARRGLSATAVDVADVGLAVAERRAEALGLQLETAQVDLTGLRLGEALAAVRSDPEAAEPSVVTCFDFLSRPLLESVAADLPIGCRFVAAIATTTNLERHPRPPARFLLEPGELVALVTGPRMGRRGRIVIRHRREGWVGGRHLAEVVVEAVVPPVGVSGR